MNVSYAPQIEAAARRHGLDPRLLAAVAAQETGGPGSNSGRNVVGDGGHGHGVFQIDDRYHPFARTAAAMDPGANADYAAGMIADNLKRFGGNVRAALSAYNAGDPRATGTTTTWADGQTLGYADSVMRHYEDLGGAVETARANQCDAASNVNGLLNALQLVPPAASSWAQQRGLDSTGHARDKSSDFSIIGGDDDNS
jgi:hypothetical protein